VEVSREDVAKVIDELLAGELTREAAALWAGKRHVEEMADPVVEEALDLLTLIDGPQIDSDMKPVGYLFDFTDLEVVRLSLDEPNA
jgi:hypothetical protein